MSRPVLPCASRSGLRPNPLLAAGLLAGLGLAAGGAAAWGEQKHRHTTRPARAAPVPPAENLVVHGQKRFSPAPMPDQAIHDPADALRDPSTGTPIGRFGRAYLDANPVPPVNPAQQGDQSPIAVGVQR